MLNYEAEIKRKDSWLACGCLLCCTPLSLSLPVLWLCTSFSLCDTFKSRRDESYGNRSCASNPWCRVLKTYHTASHYLFTRLFVFSFMLNSGEKLQKCCRKEKTQGSRSHMWPGHLVYNAEAGSQGQVEMGLTPGSGISAWKHNNKRYSQEKCLGIARDLLILHFCSRSLLLPM